MFKSGDKVVCIKPKSYFKQFDLNINTIYTIEDIEKKHIFLQGLGKLGYSLDRFILDIKEQRKRKILKCLK